MKVVKLERNSGSEKRTPTKIISLDELSHARKKKKMEASRQKAVQAAMRLNW